MRTWLCLLGVCLISASAWPQTDWKSLRESFVHPPDDSRIMMRWWWFGPSVTKPELLRELKQMKAAGVGGVEIATLYPQALDNASTGFHNVTYLSGEYVDDLRFVNQEAHRLGLRVDVTLGSGWPLGGPHIPVSEAAGQLRVEMVPVSPGETSVVVPGREAGEQSLATFLVQGDAATRDFTGLQPLPATSGDRLLLKASSAERTAVFFISSRTGMMVKRPAVGAAGFVLDHYDAEATGTHLQAVGDRLLQAFSDAPPYAVFSDSLEDYGSDWTPKLLDEFRHRRGYDLVPYLPALIGDMGPQTAAVRHDWGRTLTELADQNFMQPIAAWAHAHHTLLRSQTYGFPPVNFASNRFADLPEGEGKATLEMWREFSDTRWASSAGHLYGHNVISSETWTWLHSPAFRATPLDMKAEADLHFLQGINQLVGHGWPYSPAGEEEPGWRMYAAAALDAHNPWFGVMPELSLYLQRVSYALRLGKPAQDVALLLPEDDVWASFKARVAQHGSVTSAFGFDESGSNVTMDESMGALLDKRLVPQILDAGFSLDFIDADAINAAGIAYKALVLPATDRLPVATYRKVLAYARAGGVVLAVGHPPSTAPGLLGAEEETREIKIISDELFGGRTKTAQLVTDTNQLGATLASQLEPEVEFSPRSSAFGFTHRILNGGDLYFVANTSNQPQHVQARFKTQGAHPKLWNAYTGDVTDLGGAREVVLDLEPYGSRLLAFGDASVAHTKEPVFVRVKSTDLSSGWKVEFPGVTWAPGALPSWTEDRRLTYYSGTGTYTRTLDVDAAALAGKAKLTLAFGAGTPVPLPDPLPRFNMRAYLEGPVREVAQVYVNGQHAGSVWHPPYEVLIGPWLKPGKNQLRIDVANTAINELAGKARPSYRLLYQRYGTLFVPQDMDHLEPLPSGLLGPICLEEFHKEH